LDAEVEINSAWQTIWENINISAKEESRLFWTEEPKAMVRQTMLKIIRSKETS
jgi:hypothetical protein